MLNEPVVGGAPADLAGGVGGQGGGAGGVAEEVAGGGPPREDHGGYITVTPEEKQAIDRVSCSFQLPLAGLLQRTCYGSSSLALICDAIIGYFVSYTIKRILAFFKLKI